MDHLQSNIFVASQRINDLTGYSGIEALKNQIVALETAVTDTQDAVREARTAYKTTVAQRASTQREVTTLLARKDTWSPGDLERFTSLYRSDHSNEQAVQEAATKLAEAEREAERATSKLSSSILARYHEEQIWSDKIRQMSTWGTWGLMGVNVLLFLVFQFGFEPWRRKRLVAGFEEKVHEALVREKEATAQLHYLQGMNAVKSSGQSEDTKVDEILVAEAQEVESEINSESASSDPAIEAVAAAISAESGEIPPGEVMAASQESGPDISPPTFDWRNLDSWKAAILDLFSENKILLSKQDVTVIALEGAAVGASIVGLVATFLLRGT
jgi:sensitive to high expression protein 9